MGSPSAEFQPLQGDLCNESEAPPEVAAGGLEGGGRGVYGGRVRGGAAMETGTEKEAAKIETEPMYLTH